MSGSPSDQAARDRIRTDLATNLLVEAGAGSGKTTALVERMLHHIVSGTSVEHLAAVTFTRKAADELRERFQLALERTAIAAPPESDTHQRCARALRELDHAFLGTIHSFAARLLRDRPIEAGLDPEFEEVDDIDDVVMTESFWREWIEAARLEQDPDLAALASCGVDPANLQHAFARVRQFADVEFPSPEVAAPAVTACMATLSVMLDRGLALLETVQPGRAMDNLKKLLQSLEYQRSTRDWSDLRVACSVLENISEGNAKVTQNTWSDEKAGKAAAKALSDDFTQFITTTVLPIARQWREHRYPVVMRVLRRAVKEFAEQREFHGTLGFDDLLRLATALVREHPTVRASFGARYPFLLVDEFQDTDPVQAELCLLLASDPAQGNNWHTVVPRAGALFVVGDPKQSIYRFRRADIQIYERVRQRFADFGATLRLTSNFRSTSDIAALVNAHFATVLPAEANGVQAAFSPLIAERAAATAPTAGIFRQVVRVGPRPSDAGIVEADASTVASWVADRIQAGERPADFLILTYKKEHIATYARALAGLNIAASTTGASLTTEYELREVIVLLRALADPGNAVRVAAVLEGLFFGHSPADLFDASRAQVPLAISTPVRGDLLPVERSLAQLRGWWTFARQQPADILLERIFDETGLLCLAAGADLGESRAGALLHLVEVVRAEASAGRSGIVDAIAVLDALLDGDADDAPLRPGRGDAVRVMNLHKAKGLEAEIVVLAAPTDRRAFEPDVFIARGNDGASTGGVLVSRLVRNRRQPIAQPVGWADMAATETQFGDAEVERLRYVAATRARRALLVSQAVKATKEPSPDASIWRPLAASLDAIGVTEIQPTLVTAAGRATLDADLEALAAQATAAITRVSEARAPSLIVETVTGSIKGDTDYVEKPGRSAAVSGRAWGSAVHRCIDAMVRGRSGESLRQFAQAVLDDERLGPARLPALLALLEQVQRAPVFRDAIKSGMAQSELAVMLAEAGADRVVITEGVIDLAMRGGDGWTVIDWKSDDADDARWAQLSQGYGAQAARYASILQQVTGMPATAAVERVRPS